MDTNYAMTVLKKSKMFSSFEDSQLDTLVFLGYPREFSEGETIYEKGEASNERFGLILSGSVNILTRQGVTFKIVGSGEVIGEIALSEPHHKRTATVTAAEPTEILEWDVNHVKQQIPGLWKKLLKLAWKHLNEFYD